MRYSPLKVQRELRGLSQAQVAEALGVSPRTVRRWEQGMSVPLPYYHKRLQVLLGKTAQELGLVSDLYEHDEAEEPPAAEPDAPTQASFLADSTVSKTSSTNNSRKRYGLRIRMSLSLPGVIHWNSSTGRRRPPTEQARHVTKDFLRWMPLLLTIVALIIYTLPLVIAKHDTSLHLTQTPAQVSPIPIVQPASPTPTQPVSYEAEAPENSLTGGATVIDCPGCSGGKKVSSIGKGGTVQFNNLSKNIAGAYTLTLYYIVSGRDTLMMYIRVNSGPGAYFNVLSTGNPNTVGAVNIIINLQARQNSIAFFNPSADAPDIDRIVV